MTEPLTEPAPLPHDPYAALRLTSYRFLLTSNVLGSLGAEMLAVAVGWDLYERTHSEWVLGLTGLVQFLPVFLLVLPAGQAADRYPRHLIVQIGLGVLCLSATCLGLFSAWDASLGLCLACLSLKGCARAFLMPARGSLLPLIVPTHCLSNAVTWNSSGIQLATVSGPALGGFLLAVTPEPAYVYLASAGFLCVSAWLLLGVQPRAAPAEVGTRSFASLLEGARFVRATPVLASALLLDLFAVLLGGATVLLPIFAQTILAVGPVGLGWLRAAPALGALAMALILAHRAPMQRAGLTLLVAVVGFGLATIGFGLSRSALLSFLLLILTGAFDNISVVVRGTLLQTLTPNHLRGRVSAVNALFISSSNELGAFESGVTAYYFGPILSVVGGGVGTIFVVLAIMLRCPSLLKLGSLSR